MSKIDFSSDCLLIVNKLDFVILLWKKMIKLKSLIGSELDVIS
jgi:hypothetical protein